MVEITSSQWIGSGWSVVATVTLADGSRTGSYVLDLPENASPADLEAAVLALYA